MEADIVYVRLWSGKYLVVRVQLIVGMGFKIVGFFNAESMAPEVWENDRTRASELDPSVVQEIHQTTMFYEVGQLTMAPGEDVELRDIFRFGPGNFTRQIRIV
jgi:hypothetical protein